MSGFWSRLDALLSRSIAPTTRAVLVAAIVPLLLAFAFPLWRIHMRAPQYPEGLDLSIYTYTVEGGRQNADLREINTLNHYIGMKTIDRAELSDLDWIPFALGALIVLTLRVAAIGDVRALVDITVMALYFCLFSAGRFVYKLYAYGHNLDPRAPVTVEPFTPPILGTQAVANFTVTSLPGLATLWIGLFVLVLLALNLQQLGLPLLRGAPERTRT